LVVDDDADVTQEFVVDVESRHDKEVNHHDTYKDRLYANDHHIENI
jgi:hypothetical protein